MTMAVRTRRGSSCTPILEEDEQSTFNLCILSVLQDQEIMQKIKAALYQTELAEEIKNLKQTL